jgi:hypothetical protein
VNTAFHPQERIADVFGIGGSAQAHVAAFDPAVAGETLGLNAAFFGCVERPAFQLFLEIGVLNMRKKKRILGQQFRFAVDGIVAIKFSHETDRFLIGLQ